MAENHSSRVTPRATILQDAIAFIHDRIAWTYRMEAGLALDGGDTRYICGYRHACELILTQLHEAGA